MSKTHRGGDRWLYVAMDSDDRFVRAFEDGQAACDFAERSNNDAMYVQRASLEGEVDAEAFWIAWVSVDEPVGSCHTERDGLYRAGTSEQPGRHGRRTFAGHPPIQNLDVIVCWAFTEEQAVARLRSVEIEGRARAARDKAYEAIEREGRQELARLEEGFTWDPYGMWIHRVPGLAERLKSASDAAYDEEKRRLSEVS